MGLPSGRFVQILKAVEQWLAPAGRARQHTTMRDIAGAKAKARALCQLAGNLAIDHGFRVRRRTLGFVGRKKLDTDRRISFEATTNELLDAVTVDFCFGYHDSAVSKIMHRDWVKLGDKDMANFDLVIANSIDRVANCPPPHTTHYFAQYVMEAGTSVNVAFDWLATTFPVALNFYSKNVESREVLSASLTDPVTAQRLCFGEDRRIRSRVALAFVLNHDPEVIIELLDEYERTFVEESRSPHHERFKQAVRDEMNERKR